MKPESEASGVRSSWLALATKSARMRSICCSRVRSRSTITAAFALSEWRDMGLKTPLHGNAELILDDKRGLRPPSRR